MSIYIRVLDDLKARRDRIITGQINCIPSPFPRFRSTYIGIEKGKYIIVTANTKVGKTQVADYLFLYTPLFYALSNPDKIRLKIFYFSLEMSAAEKYRQLMTHMLYIFSNGKLRIDTKHLRSVNETEPLSEEILTILESDTYKRVYQFFEENVHIIDDIRNPFGVYKFCADYAQKKGTQHYKTIDFKDADGNVTDTKTVKDFYSQDDPDEYRIIMVDHYKLFTTERGKSMYETIMDWSSNYAVKLRNTYGYSIVGIQQQMPTQESNENQKLNKLRPTLDGLADCKNTAQDADLILGLYTPFRYGIREYEGYDITKFRDHIRFLEVMGGREGGGGDICPLFFDGAVNFFKELPLPDNTTELRKFYNVLSTIFNHTPVTPGVALINTSLPHENSSFSQHWLRKVHKYWKNSRIRN